MPVYERVKLLISTAFGMGSWFTTNELCESFQDIFGHQLKTTTASTYLARLYEEGFLERSGSRNERKYIERIMGIKIAVIISDTHNRPFRLGAINIALGCSGIEPLLNYVGRKDLFGYELRASVTSIADQLCSAAGLQMGEANEGFPVIIIRGYKYKRAETPAQTLIRPEERDYFR
jgi:hypothetical protein